MILHDGMLDAAAASLLVFGLALVAIGLLRRFSAARRALILELVFPTALLLFPLALLPEVELTVLEGSTIDISSPDLSSPQNASQEDMLAVPLDARDSAAVVEQSQAQTTNPFATSPLQIWSLKAEPVSPVAISIWLVGSLLLLVRLLFQTRALSRMRESASPVGPTIETMADRVSERLSVPRTFAVVSHADVSTPLAYDDHILLPSDSNHWSESRLEVVLLHELEHLRRRDPLSGILARVVLALYWWNPLAWLCHRELLAAREFACDDSVVRAGVAASVYARELLALTPRSDRSVVATALAGSRSDMSRRIAAVLDLDRETAPARRGYVALVTLSTLMVATTVALLPWAPDSIGEERNRATRETTRPKFSTDPLERARDLRAQSDEDLSDRDLEQLLEVLADRRPVDSSALGVKRVGPRYGNLPETSPGKEAARVLIQQRGRALPLLRKALMSSDWPAREHAAWSLGRLGDRTSASLLIAALDDEQIEVRRIAAWALGEMHARVATRALERALLDPAAPVRAQAAHALGDIRDRSAVPALIAALLDEAPQVRERAAFALGDLRAPEAQRPLSTIARSDSSAEVRSTARWALRESGFRESGD